MKTEHKEQLEKLGYRILDGYIQKYVGSDKEPKIYWNNRPKTFEFQIWGWQIVAHESKAEMVLNEKTR
jgi:hypothetical protein